MRFVLLLSATLVCLMLAGCTSIRVSQDYDPEAQRTTFSAWNWKQAGQPETGDVRVDSPLLDRRVRRAVGNAMAGRKMVLTDQAPEVVLSYHLAIEQKIEGQPVSTGFGMGRYYPPRYPWYGEVETGTRIRQIDISRLIIDVWDAQTNELIWRGQGEWRTRTYATPQQADEAMQKRVDKILAQLPEAFPQ